MNQVVTVYFSPAHTCRNTAQAFSRGTGMPSLEYDLTLPAGRGKDIDIPEDALVVLCAPVYGGHTVQLFMKELPNIHGRGNPTVIISVYGNRHYDRALQDLYDGALSCGLRPFAWGTFIGEHSFTSRIQTGRPDERDLAEAEAFGALAAQYADTAEMLDALDVPGRDVDYGMIGMHGQRLGHLTPNRPVPTKDCVQCGICASVCPLGLINPRNSDDIKESCMKCGACVKLCPYGAMQFPQEDFRIVQEDCIAEFGSDVHVPEYFINRKGE
ncbi:MAG: 4Fe-4S binding protein [Solobacterium sp.]|nr:4Fe-4S binding protein [Solobacterium sp.]